MYIIAYHCYKTYKLKLSETVLFPWPEKADFIVAFEAYSDEALSLPVNSLSIPGYSTTNCFGYLTGIANRISMPCGIFTSPSDFLNKLFPEFSHCMQPPLTIKHPLLYTIPDGKLGAGYIIARNILDKSKNDIVLSSIMLRKNHEMRKYEHRFEILRGMKFLVHENIKYTHVSDLIQPVKDVITPQSIISRASKILFNVRLRSFTSHRFVHRIQKLTLIDIQEVRQLCKSGGIIAKNLDKEVAERLVSDLEELSVRAWIE